jgi:hypothetical protein
MRFMHIPIPSWMPYPEPVCVSERSVEIEVLIIGQLRIGRDVIQLVHECGCLEDVWMGSGEDLWSSPTETDN